MKKVLAFIGSVIAVVTFLEVVVPYLKVTYDIGFTLFNTPENQRILNQKMHKYVEDFQDSLEVITANQRQLLDDLRERSGNEFYAVGLRASANGNYIWRDHFNNAYRVNVFNDSVWFYTDRSGVAHVIPHPYYPAHIPTLSGF